MNSCQEWVWGLRQWVGPLKLQVPRQSVSEMEAAGYNTSYRTTQHVKWFHRIYRWNYTWINRTAGCRIRRKNKFLVNLGHSLKYLNKVQNVLSKYQLPTLNELWKSNVKEAVNKWAYWIESIRKITTPLSQHRLFEFWKDPSCLIFYDLIVSDVKKGTIKYRI